MRTRANKYNYQSGDVIGNLVFLNREPYMESESSRHPMAKFKCVCGKEIVTRIDNVKMKRVSSCGCKSGELRSKSLTKYESTELLSNGVRTIPYISEKESLRFWSKVAITAHPNLCWIWQATGERYGNFSVGKSQYKSNRIAYFLHYKEDPKELSVMHSCDNPKCCNPAHLSLGTHLENMQDMASKGRAKKNSLTH